MQCLRFSSFSQGDKVGSVIDEHQGNKRFLPERVIVERGSETSSIFHNLRRNLPQVPFDVVENASTLDLKGSLFGDYFGAAKRKLLLTKHRGDFFKKCPGSEGQVCCNYFVINFASNCPMDCSYCYLQEYLSDNAALKVFSNLGDLIDEADRRLKKHRGVFFRIGTGEITDSLALEPLTGTVRELIPYFAEQPNVLLELKTKSDCIDGLMNLDSKGRVVVAWSMNPQRVIDLDEHGTASLRERLNAAHRCQEAGYRLGFHFDPIIEYPGWEIDYRAMIEKIFSTIDWRWLAWLSLGVLRNTPGLKRTIRERFPRTKILTGEQVLCKDGKLRYFHPLRVEIYRKMVRWIRHHAPTVKIYLCMESHEVWQQVFGFAPACEKELGNQMSPAVHSIVYS